MLASLGLLLFLFSCVQGQHAISFHNDVIYIYSNFKNTWDEARGNCVSLYNANLVVIDTNQIQRDVQKVFKRITSKDDHYWIALHYTSSTAWTWPGNVSPLITHWRSGTTASNASCAAMAVKGGLWIPFPCSTRKPYICYGKVQIQNTSQEYVVSQVKLRQHNAESVCTQGGNRTLATILSMQDEQVIENSIAMDNHSDYYIGLKANAGRYMWSNGANLTEGKDYTNWGTGYPNTTLGECVVLSNNGSGKWEWRNMECETITHKFICQKPTMATSTTVPPTTQETETSTAKMKESTAATTKMIAATVGSMHGTSSGGSDQRPEAIFIFCTMFLAFSMLFI